MLGKYRPVSLTTVVCYIYEELIRDYIQEFVSDDGFISNNQYGFMKDHYCQTNLSTYYEEVRSYIEK